MLRAMPSNATLIEWGPELELGIPLLDAQHRSLIDLANRLFEELKRDKAGEEARRAVAELFAYSATHFADEEAFFERFNFPSRDRHASSHEAFIARAAEFEDRLTAGSPAETAELLAFLQSWIRRHIAREDRELVRVARRAGQLDQAPADARSCR
jgi:hemerythrin-like metal-binding protein